MVLKHYVDSMIVGDLYPLPSPLMDIGSGAGFPGICLKIRYPKLRLILAEPKPNLVEFLNEVVALLDLKGIEVFEHRVTSQSFQTPVAGAITRAVEPMNKTILRTLGCLGCGGKLIFMKGPSVQSEIDSLKREFSTTHRILYDKRYSLPRTPYQRRLVVVERIQE